MTHIIHELDQSSLSLSGQQLTDPCTTGAGETFPFLEHCRSDITGVKKRICTMTATRSFCAFGVVFRTTKQKGSLNRDVLLIITC